MCPFSSLGLFEKRLRGVRQETSSCVGKGATRANVHLFWRKQIHACASTSRSRKLGAESGQVPDSLLTHVFVHKTHFARTPRRLRDDSAESAEEEGPEPGKKCDESEHAPILNKEEAFAVLQVCGVVTPARSRRGVVCPFSSLGVFETRRRRVLQ